MEYFAYHIIKIIYIIVSVKYLFYFIVNFNTLPLIFRWVTLHIIIFCGLEVTSEIFHWSTTSNNILIFYIHTITDFLFWGICYSRFLIEEKSKLPTRFALCSIFLITAYMITESIVSYFFNITHVYGKGLANLLIIVFCGMFLIKNIRLRFEKNSKYFIPINITLLLCNSISLDFLLALTHSHFISNNSLYIILGINHISHIIVYRVAEVSLSKQVKVGKQEPITQ